MKTRFIRKADIIVIAALLFLAAVLLLPGLFHKSDSLKAQIIKNGEIIDTVDLSQVEKSYIIDLDNAKILVEKDAISFAEADCPDKLCVKCGRLTRSGDTAVCVPTGTVLKTVGNENEIDAISY